MNIDKEIEGLVKNLTALKNKKAELLNLSDDKRLAEHLHEKVCNTNHTDGCGWHYESWSNMGFSRNYYLEKAINILKVTDIKTASNVINCL